MNKHHYVLHASGNGSMNESWLSQTGDAKKSRQAGTIQILLQNVLSGYKATKAMQEHDEHDSSSC
ncbi:hypothetical protein [Desulfonatronum parangueonense]